MKQTNKTNMNAIVKRMEYNFFFWDIFDVVPTVELLQDNAKENVRIKQTNICMKLFLLIII